VIVLELLLLLELPCPGKLLRVLLCSLLLLFKFIKVLDDGKSGTRIRTRT
jgi:hypothetical protein